MTERLKQLLTFIVPFSEEQLSVIMPYFRPKAVKKNQFLLSQGEVCEEFYFIYKGCISTAFLTLEGQEKTRYVMADCSIGTALSSFISHTPSFEFMDALEDSELLAIRREDFYKLNEEMTAWRLFYQRILEMAYSFQNKKIEALVTLTAKQRYEHLLKENPLLVQRLSNKVLASYLDITQETMSRIKTK